MEILLRYALFRIAVVVVGFELLVLLLSTVAIILIKWNAKRKKRRDEELSLGLTEHLTRSYMSGSYKKIPESLNSYPHIVQAMEKFDHTISDNLWTSLKETYVKKELLATAKSTATSWDWVKRQLAARVYLLAPNFATREEILAFLHDSKYLVRVTASSIITRTGSKEELHAVVRQMAKESKLSRFAYRDALLQMDEKKFRWLLEILQEDKNPEVQAICLDIFSMRTTDNLFPKLVPFIYSENKELKILAIAVLKSIPSPEANDILIHCLEDESPKVRAEALKSIDPHLAEKEIGTLEALLSDPEWFVRLQAALRLRSLGERGMRILAEQTPKKSMTAHEISDYVLALPA